MELNSELASRLKRGMEAKAKEKSGARPQSEVDPAEVQAIRARITGLLIRDARVAKGFSMEHLAELMQMTPETLVALEFGAQSPSLPQLELLAYWLEVPVSHFLAGTETLSQQLARRQIDPAEYERLRDRMIGATLQALRTERGYTLDYLAQLTQLEPSLLTEYEYGRVGIPFIHLLELARALGATVNTFLEGQNRVGRFLQAQELFHEFLKMPPEMRDFIANPTNQRYIELAQRFAQIDTGKLRQIAEMLLEITL